MYVNKTGRHFLTNFREQMKVHNHLKAVLDVEAATSSGIAYVKYKEGWDDAKVGDKFGYTTGQIIEFRKKNIGEFNPGGRKYKYSKEVMGQLHDSLDAAFRKIDELERRIMALEDRYTSPNGQSTVRRAGLFHNETDQ